jgi:formate hydrogenlyase subunit 7
MSFWFWHGLRKGIHSTRYPRALDTSPGITPGRPITTQFSQPEQAGAAESECPVHAIKAAGARAVVDIRTCVWCQRCRVGTSNPMKWEDSYQWAQLSDLNRARPQLPTPFAHSLHVMVVDAGDCGACLHEVKQLNNPFYNMHRLGIFTTATPRLADVLLVVGPVSENMRGPLLKTYEAMPMPKRVMAVGTCAISGGVFGRTFVSSGGVGNVLPVDIETPGDPPPPLAILHSLLILAGRRVPSLQLAQTAEKVSL